MAGTEVEDIQARSAFRVVRLRLPWLVTTLIGELFVSVIIRHYEYTLSQIIALAAFLPLIAAMGGNVGSQSAMVVVRSLAMGQRSVRGFRAVFREFRVGLVLGICYGIILAGAAYLLFGDRLPPSFAWVVGIGICVSMTVASTLGALGPLLFQKLGIDPATATGPLITTITDLISISAYLFLATAILL